MHFSQGMWWRWGRGGGGGRRKAQQIPCDQFSCNNLFSPSWRSHTWEHSGVFHHYLSPFCAKQLISTAIPAIKMKKNQTAFSLNTRRPVPLSAMNLLNVGYLMPLELCKYFVKKTNKLLHAECTERFKKIKSFDALAVARAPGTGSLSVILWRTKQLTGIGAHMETLRTSNLGRQLVIEWNQLNQNQSILLLFYELDSH